MELRLIKFVLINVSIFCLFYVQKTGAIEENLTENLDVETTTLIGDALMKSDHPISTDSDDIGIENELLNLVGLTGEGRTYVHHFAKRMAVLLLPLMFKLGVVMTMLAFLTVISVKSLVVGVGLMVIGLSHVLARAYQSSAIQQNSPPIILSAPSAYPALLRQPLPNFLTPTGWERRNGIAPRSSQTVEQDPYKGYLQAADTTATGTTPSGINSFYVINSAPADTGVLQSYN